MKQLLFLLLFPCLALAQYQGNANQKITLGEQTTADGLVYRGVASIDTVTATTKITRANKQDTSAYLLLDTVTNLLWHYKIGSNEWTQAGGSTFDTTTLNLVSRFALKLNIADTATMLTNYYRSGRALGTPLSGVLTNATGLPISTGLTGLGAANRVPYTSSTTALTTSSGLTFDGTNFATTGTVTAKGILTVNEDGVGIKNITIRSDYAGVDPAINVTTSNSLLLMTSNTERIRITNGGNVGIGTGSPAVQFHTTGAVRFATFAGGGTTTLDVDNTGNLARTSSIELKKDVTPINYGLNQILQINPINFNWINEDKYGNENENGFIAEDVMNVIPNVVGSDAHGLFMDYTKLIPILTKAIQEQQALIKALEKRIINLENK